VIKKIKNINQKYENFSFLIYVFGIWFLMFGLEGEHGEKA
jgi:hypothetical protein